MSLRIFLVEDSRTIRDNLVPAIEEMAGARVVQVVDGEQDARSWQNTNDDWSMAVVDLFIKDGSGFGVLNAEQTPCWSTCRRAVELRDAKHASEVPGSGRRPSVR